MIKIYKWNDPTAPKLGYTIDPEIWRELDRRIIEYYSKPEMVATKDGLTINRK